jgi:iron complex outermembrane recepter protein
MLRRKASAGGDGPHGPAPVILPGAGHFDWGAADAMIASALLLFLVLAGPAVAARPAPAVRPRLADSVTVVSGVEVARERALSDARRLQPTAFVTDLRADDRARTTANLSELLATAAGVHVTQYGGLGAFSTLSLRGASPGQVTILLDGVPLTSAAHGVVSLGDLPATAIERVEIYRGLGPLGLGVATPGGAVNLVTVSSPGLRELHLSRGSFGTWEGRATGGLERGSLALLLHAGYQGSDGDYRYLDDHGTAYNATDDTVRTRVNDRFDAWTTLAGLTWRPRAELRARLRGDVFARAQGLPGRGASPALGTRLAFLRSLGTAEIERTGTGLVPTATLRLSADRTRSRFRDLRLADRGELGFGRHDTDDRTRADGLVLSLAWARPAPWLALEGVASLRREGADPHDAVATSDPPDSHRDARGAMMRVQLQTPGGRLVLHAARRWDRLADHLRSTAGGLGLTVSDVVRELDSPQLGARLGLAWGLEARANWARAARAPEFVELFGDQASIAGNPQLVPETAENRDAGLAWRGRWRGHEGALEWARYRSDARDLVAFVRNSASTVRATNFGRARIRGEEWTVRLELPGRLQLASAWSWQSAINLGPLPEFYVGKRLPGRPARQGTTRLEWRPGRPFGLRASAEVQTIGDNVLDPYNLQRVAARTLVGASVSVAPLRRPLRVTLEGRNLGDDRACDVGGFPLPGRSVYVACTWREGDGREP